MEGYLGDFEINIETHPEFSTYTREDWAMYFITLFSGIDGSHHKDWLIDQIARILKGTPMVVVEAQWDNGYSEYRVSTGDPSEEYLEWVQEMLGEVDEDGEYEYSYDEGIAP